MFKSAVKMGESVSSVSMLVGSRRNFRELKCVRVLLHQLVKQLVDMVGVGNQAGADAADDAAGHIRAAMRRGQKNDPADEWQRIEEEIATQLFQDLARAQDFVERSIRIEPPELVAAGDRHGPAQNAAHAVSHQDHLLERRIRPSGSYIILA